jgi:hypothetical protein
MPIDTSKLVVAPVLQDYLVDKATGEALTAGVVTCYKDNSRNTLKNWYYQSGVYPNYTYIALPNPLTLSAAGTIVDESGNDVLPMFYPFAESDHSTRETYYITVVNSTGTSQFTRQNFPFEGTPSGPVTIATPTLQNTIINNRFWRAGNSSSSVNSAGVVTVTLTNETDIDVCPSQHDGFSYPDIRFLKDAAGATESAVFQKFAVGSGAFSNAVRPEYYLNHVSTGVGAETYKKYLFPISLHIATLDSVEAIFSVFLKLNNGNSNGTVTAKILQYMGSGSGNTANFELELDAHVATASWNQYQSKFTFPSTLGKTYDAGQIQDSAFYLELYLQPNVTLDISIAIPSIYLGDTIPTTDFSSYDEIDSIINSPRTGDFRHTLNRSQPGWVPANDGTIGSSASGATTRANPDTWPLYKLIWENTSATWTPMGDASARGADAKTDFSANRSLTLTKNLGRVLQGLDPIFVTPSTFTATVATNSVTAVATGANAEFTVSATFFTGQPLQFNSTGTLPHVVVPGANLSIGEILTANTTYYAIYVSATRIKLAFTLAEALAGTAMNVVSAGVQPNTIINTNNVLTLGTSQSPVLKAGTAVILTNSGGALPSGLSASTVYYITTRSLAATTITLSDNLSDALNGYYIPILSNGTGTHTINNALGAYNGASYTTDVPLHKHVGNDIVWSSLNALHTTPNAGGFDFNDEVGQDTHLEGTERVSLIQPSAYTNVFLKL